MVKAKKKTDVAVGEDLAPAITTLKELPEPTFEDVSVEEQAESFEFAAPEPPKEILLTVRVVENFKDGALAARFAKYGYPVLWKAGETRNIPMGLFVRCKRSGAKFEL